MKTYFIIAFFILAFSLLADGRKTILVHVESFFDEKLVWSIPADKAIKLPKWVPDDGSPPLSLTNAISTARKWIKTSPENLFHVDGSVERIEICPLDLDSPDFKYVYFYKIYFQVGTYGNHASCYVLMDNTIVIPEVVK